MAVSAMSRTCRQLWRRQRCAETRGYRRWARQESPDRSRRWRALLPNAGRATTNRKQDWTVVLAKNCAAARTCMTASSALAIWPPANLERSVTACVPGAGGCPDSFAKVGSADASPTGSGSGSSSSCEPAEYERNWLPVQRFAESAKGGLGGSPNSRGTKYRSRPGR